MVDLAIVPGDLNLSGSLKRDGALAIFSSVVFKRNELHAGTNLRVLDICFGHVILQFQTARTS